MSIQTPGADAATSDHPHPRTVRGRGLGRFSLAVAVLAAGALGVGAFGALAAVDLSSLHPFQPTWGFLTLFAVASAAAVLALLLSVVALFACRPRAVALMAVTASLVLPVAAVWLAVGAGVAVLKGNVARDLTTDARVVARALDVLETWQVDVTSLRSLLPEVR